MAAKSIGSIISGIRSQGMLPERVKDNRYGTVLVWDDEQQAYCVSGARLYVWPDVVRNGWGRRFFGFTAPVQQQMELV